MAQHFLAGKVGLLARDAVRRFCDYLLHAST